MSSVLSLNLLLLDVMIRWYCDDVTGIDYFIQSECMSVMDWTHTDLMKHLKDSQMYRQRGAGARNWLKVRQQAPECNLIHYLSEQ